MSILEAQVAKDVSNACVAGLRNIKYFLCLLFVEKDDSKRRESSWFGDMFEVVVKIGVLFLPFQEVFLLFFIFLQILRKLNRHDELFYCKVIGFSLCFFIDVTSFFMNHFKNILFCNSFGKLTHKQRIVTGAINLIIAPLVTFSKLVDQVLQNEEKEDDECHEEVILDGDSFAVLDFVGNRKSQEEAVLASSITTAALEIGDHRINGMKDEEYSEEDDRQSNENEHERNSRAKICKLLNWIVAERDDNFLVPHTSAATGALMEIIMFIICAFPDPTS